MISSNNKRMILQFVEDTNPHYGLRKLSIGVASVLLGTVFAINEHAYADTVNNQPAKTNQQQNNENINQPYEAQNEQLSQLNAVTVKQNQNVTNGMTNPINNNNTTQVLNLGKPESTNQIQINPEILNESKAVSVTTNGGFDQATWGTLNVSKWQGQYYDGYYKLTNYTGDLNHIIIPNQADFQKAGRNVGQVGIDRILTHSWFLNGKSPISIAFSKTDGKTVKALGQDFDSAFSNRVNLLDIGKLPGDTWTDNRNNLQNFDGANLDVSQVTSINDIFNACELNNIDSLSTWNTSNIISMTRAFYGNYKLSDLSSLKNWDVSHVRTFDYMFQTSKTAFPLNDDEYGHITDLTPLANWNTKSAEDIGHMFADNKITTLVPLAKWNVSNVTNLTSIFAFNKLKNLHGIENWNLSKTPDLMDAFSNNQINDLSAIANWKLPKCTSLKAAFENNQISDLSPLKDWNISSITSLEDTFNENKIENLLPIENWNVQNVSSFAECFENNLISDLTPISNWKINKAQSLTHMLAGNKIKNLQPLANWNVYNANNLSAMFYNNQIEDLNPLKNWNIANATNINFMFAGNFIKDLSPLTNWNTKNITDMSETFSNNKIEKLSPLSKWNTSNVTNMAFMFDKNQISNISPLANWNVLKVTSMAEMFRNNPVQLIDFRKWNLNNIKYLSNFVTSWDNKKHPSQMPSKQLIIITNNNNLAILQKNKSKSGDFLPEEYPIINSLPNSLTVDLTSIEMPTIYTTTDTTTPAEQLAKQLVKRTRQQKLQDYAKQNNLDANKIQLITPDPTDHAYDAPVIMANQKYQTEIPNTINYQFVDDDNKDANVGRVISYSGNQNAVSNANLQIPTNYALAPGQILPCENNFTNQDQTIKIHLVHATTLVTRQKQIKRTINYVDNHGHHLKSSAIQTSQQITEYGTQDLISHDIKWNNWIPTQQTYYKKFAIPQISGYKSFLNGKPAKFVPAQGVSFDKNGKPMNITCYVTYEPDNSATTKSDTFIASDTPTTLNLTQISSTQATKQYQTATRTIIIKTTDGSSYTTETQPVEYYRSQDNIQATLPLLSNPIIQGYITNSANIAALPVTIHSNDSTVNVIYHKLGQVTLVDENNQPITNINPITYSNDPNDPTKVLTNPIKIPAITGYVPETTTVIPSLDPTQNTYVKYRKLTKSTITINFKDTNNKTILSVPTTNTEGTTQSIAALIPDGYIPYSGQNVPTKITFDAQNHTYDIVLTHRCLLIYPTDNYQANQIIPGTTTKKIPSSFNMNNLHKEITRTINITLPTGKKQQIIQSAQFARQAILDTVTGEIDYQPWNYNGQYTLSSYLPQPIDGYNIQPIKKVVVTPTSENMVENLQYQPNNYYAKIKYQTTDGKTIKLTDPIQINSATIIKLLAPTGYRLLTNINQISLSAINENQTLNVLVAPTNITYTANDQLPTAIKEPLAKAITRTIMITLPNGKIKTIKQQVNFTRTATVNSDGTVTYNDWQATNRPQFNKIFLPKHHGYKLVITQDNQPLTAINKINNVTAKTTDSTFIVKYIKQ